MVFSRNVSLFTHGSGSSRYEIDIIPCSCHVGINTKSTQEFPEYLPISPSQEMFYIMLHVFTFQPISLGMIKSRVAVIIILGTIPFILLFIFLFYYFIIYLPFRQAYHKGRQCLGSYSFSHAII